MLKTLKSVNRTATSTIEVNGTETVVATMNANVSDSGNINVNNIHIQNKELFESNKETVFTDITTFLKELYGMEA